MLLIDTNIIIDHLRGRLPATKFVQTAGKPNFAISVVVEMELYNGVLNATELAKIRKELSGYTRIPLNDRIGKLGLWLSAK